MTEIHSALILLLFLLQAMSPWLLSFTPMVKCHLASRFSSCQQCYNVPYLSLNMFLGGDQRDRDSATAYSKNIDSFTFRKFIRRQTKCKVFWVSLLIWPGMSVEMVAMLLASVIQGQVVAVYNTEKQEACRDWDQDRETPQSTSSPQTASFQQTVCYSQRGANTLFFISCYIWIFILNMAKHI